MFKQQLTVLKDSGPDMDRQIKEFQTMLGCHAFGRKGVRPVGMLNLFRKTLPVGATRLKVYDTYLRKVWKGGLIGLMPHDAQAVYEGVLAKLRTVVRETAMQRQGRVEKAFEDFSVGRMSHLTFQAERAHLLVEMERTRIDPLSETMRFRRHLSKMSPDLKRAILCSGL